MQTSGTAARKLKELLEKHPEIDENYAMDYLGFVSVFKEFLVIT